MCGRAAAFRRRTAPVGPAAAFPPGGGGHGREHEGLISYAAADLESRSRQKFGPSSDFRAMTIEYTSWLDFSSLGRIVARLLATLARRG